MIVINLKKRTSYSKNDMAKELKGSKGYVDYIRNYEVLMYDILDSRKDRQSCEINFSLVLKVQVHQKIKKKE